MRFYERHKWTLLDAVLAGSSFLIGVLSAYSCRKWIEVLSGP